MPEREEDRESISEPLPEDLQKIVDKEESDRQIRADYENSFTSTSPKHSLKELVTERLDENPDVPHNSSEKTQEKSQG
ncbi:hypothetical protein DTO013E5_3827 [Penicillium roqueforti]|uniref:Genomic scaffold, ProqFM164S01 n=1 Tax=Penicillium roqueforti (strain FM164) TaxID=1365484 RepID=W6PWJ4_PENRF|nr:uncharacterized protein LCP9604111_1742 [Penicillium roqueforti]CDM28270.1 unnamed protein product [Penicillium roqueforti FM164]KAF9251746.1 hypothetical protein LCP9604111_1742 [Penicillium roqueforti]KAI1836440.1 hypothetical protein CBS147337_2667 [Penicillium roqueforti]KAI2685422.1 hypothetical protein LCP963914a_4749 [Penicillium roqueforti]KAI2690215.1 hypothetical protein CBS147355_666 [Penicillium roqueforti]